MTPRLRLRLEAEAELQAAFHWYEVHQPGLGGDFIREIDRAFGSIQEQPTFYRELHRNIRRVLLRRFP